MQKDHTFQLKFGQLSYAEFWLSTKSEYPELGKEAVNCFVHFSTTYMCELGFSAMIIVKNKKRERLLSLDAEMRVCLSHIRPRIIDLLCKNKQVQVSH